MNTLHVKLLTLGKEEIRKHRIGIFGFVGYFLKIFL